MSGFVGRVALVTPFFGREALLPDERFAFRLATELVASGAEVCVLATCGRSAADDWSANYYRSGRDLSEGFPVERFRLNARDRPAYDAALVRLAGGAAGDADVAAFLNEGVRSETLLAELRASADAYDAFVFTPGAVATTWHGIEIVAERAIVVPRSPEGVLPRAVWERLYGARVLVARDETERRVLAAQARPGVSAVIEVAGPARDDDAAWTIFGDALSALVRALPSIDDGRSRAEALAQVAYLYPIVRRQRNIIIAMQRSRFWTLRNRWFDIKRRFGIGGDPVPVLRAEQEAAEAGAVSDPYVLWQRLNAVRPADAERARRVIGLLPSQPRVIVFVDAREARAGEIAATLASLDAQWWTEWRAAVWDASDGQAAAERASDDVSWYALLRAGDTLEPNALYEVMLRATADPSLVAIYADDDERDDRGHLREPRFKPDWSPESALSRDYIGRSAVVRGDAVAAAGDFDVRDPAVVYDLLLRLGDRYPTGIAHVALPLWHCAGGRLTPPQERRVIEAALVRRGRPADVVTLADRGGHAIHWRRPEPSPRVTIVIPTRDRAAMMERCLRSVFERSTYGAFEVIVVDNGSREPETAALFENWLLREPERLRVMRIDEPFNYSRLNNRAVAASDADVIVLLNNDTVVITPNWIEGLVEQAIQPDIGAVGAMLLYEDDTVQHAGVVLGILELAGHAHRGLRANAPGYRETLQAVTNYSAVTGACLAVARLRYLQAGGLDEGLAVAFNDVDFCLKLRALGYRNLYLPYVRLYHLESKSRGGEDTFAKIKRAVNEREIVRARHPEACARDPYYNPNLTADAETFGLRF